jgi:hypothetical protein
MAFRHKFTIMCDEIRQENNGKFIVLGLYTPNMTVASLPAVLPSLTFLTSLESDHVGTFTQKINLQSLENGKILASATSMLDVRPAPNGNPPWYVLSAVGFRNVMLDHAGTYTFTLALEGEADPIVHQFDVILNVPNQVRFPSLPVRR